MAKFLTTSTLTDVRGKLGGFVLKRSRWGPLIYLHSKHRHPASTQTEPMRRAFAFLANAWKDTLTQNHRNTWESLPSIYPWRRYVFRPPALPGYNRYLQYNLLRQVHGVPLFSIAPASPRRTPPWERVVQSAAPNKIEISHHAHALPADQDEICTVSWPVTESQVNPRTWSRQTFFKAGPAGGWVTHRLSQPYLRPSWVLVTLTILDDNLLQSIPWQIRLWCPA